MASVTALATAHPSRIRRELGIYFGLVFFITWGIGAVLLLFPEATAALFGEFGPQSPLFFAAVYAPSVTGIVLTAAFQGRAGLIGLWRRLVMRISWRWWLVALFAYPAAWLVLQVVTTLIGVQQGGLGLERWYAVWPTIVLLTPALLTDPGPIGEEFGWRGFALPRLLEVMRPLDAALILGVIWAVWHLPAFAMSGLSHSHMSAPLFLLSVTGVGILIAWLFIRVRGSILVGGILPHFVINSSAAAGITNFDSVEMLIVTWGLVAIVVVTGGRDLGRGPWRREL